MKKEYTDISLSNTIRKDKSFPSDFKARTGQILCHGVDIRIDRHGTWFYQNSQINRIELVKLFAKALHRDDDGNYWLITTSEICHVTVEEAPFIITDLTVLNSGQNQTVQFKTNVGTIIDLDKEYLIKMENKKTFMKPKPFLTLGNYPEAKLSRPVFYELVDLCKNIKINNRMKFGVWSKNNFFILGPSVDVKS